MHYKGLGKDKKYNNVQYNSPHGADTVCISRYPIIYVFWDIWKYIVCIQGRIVLFYFCIISISSDH